VAWTLKPVEKANKKMKSKYFMLEFSFEQVDEKTKVFHDTIRSEHKFYREYTLTLSGVTELAAKHWHNVPNKAITSDLMEPKALPESVPVPVPVPAKKN
jgi:hypothetical protein